jgi:hypothetical protein
MQQPPCIHQRGPVARDQPQNAIGLTLVTANDISDLRRRKVDDDHPSGSKNMNMRGRMVVGVDNDPQTVDAQDRGHDWR